MTIPSSHAINIDFFSLFEYFSTNFVNPDVALAFRIIAINDPKIPTVRITHMLPVSDIVSYKKPRYPSKNPLP